MSLTNITIGGATYPSYATVAEADAYLAVDPERRRAWAALDTDTKGVNLAAATRRLDGLRWAGRRAADAQATEWPRVDATPPTTGIPSEIERAAILLAGDLAVDPSSLSATPSEGDVQSERIGPLAVSYFHRERQSGMMRRLGGNAEVLSLIRQWLAGAPVSPPVATGTDAESAFTPRDRYGRTEGIG